eukprot:SAG22_NODE_1269_length_4943_cov_2.834434_1_plen_905_part_00
MAGQDASIKTVGGLAAHFIVDGFNFVDPCCQHYFLTHFHSDHTVGLHAGFDVGTIYCSTVTAELVVAVIGVRRKNVCAAEVGQTIEVDGVRVTLLEANHCPGAVMFHFWDPRTQQAALHTGDFRAAPSVCSDPRLAQLLRDHNGLDALYLDTTYCNPRHCFPPQPDVCDAIEAIARRESQSAELAPRDLQAVPVGDGAATAHDVQPQPQPQPRRRPGRTLFVVGSYSIGKENAIEAVCRGAGSQALVSPARARTLKLSGRWDPALYTLTDRDSTGDPPPPATATATSAAAAVAAATATSAAAAGPVRVRVAAMGGAADHAEARRLLESEPPGRWDAVVCFRPTGWTFSRAQQQQAANAGGGGLHYRPWVENGGRTRLYQVPYSEHSSWPELRAFVAAVRPRKLVPTVNLAESERLVNAFVDCMDLRHDRGRIDAYLGRPGGGGGGGAASCCGAAGGGQFSQKTVEQQQRLWDRFQCDNRRDQTVTVADKGRSTGRPLVPTAAAAAGEQPARRSEPRQPPGHRHDSEPSSIGGVAGDVEFRAALTAIMGPVGPAYARQLREDSGGQLEAALSIHFGANGGQTPPQFADDPEAAVDGTASAELAHYDDAGGGCAAAAAAGKGQRRSTAAAAERSTVKGRTVDPSRPLAGVVVAALEGRGSSGGYRLFESREKAAGWLKQLGATVMTRITPRCGGCLVPEGTKRQQVTKCPPAASGFTVLPESWLIRLVRAAQLGHLPPSAADTQTVLGVLECQRQASQRQPAAKRSQVAESWSESPNASRRRLLVPTAEKMSRLARALSERLFLLEWSAVVRQPPAAVANGPPPPPHHRFGATDDSIVLCARGRQPLSTRWLCIGTTFEHNLMCAFTRSLPVPSHLQWCSAQPGMSTQSRSASGRLATAGTRPTAG